MPIEEMVRLFPTVMMAAYNGMEKIFADGEPTYIGGVSYWALDIQNLRVKMANVVGEGYTRSSLREAASMEEAVRAERLAEEKYKEEEAQKAQEEKERLEKEKLEKEKKDKKEIANKKRQDKKTTDRENSRP